MSKLFFLFVTSFVFIGCAQNNQSSLKYWPQSSGPNTNWAVQTEENFAHEFSVRTGEHILWTMDLPEVGQGGITIWEDKIFLTVMDPVYEELEKKDRKTNTILALCIDATKREVVWQKEIVGSVKSPYFYGFSDSTTPTPVTDGKYVWFFNASGKIVCYDMNGTHIWERAWEPVEQIGEIHYPFNKQFEPILYNNILINMESYSKNDGKREYGWNYLYGLDKNTGKVKWISEEGLTHYSTPTFNTTASGIPAMLVGRGAHHRVPESPKGYSLIDLNTGKSLWKYKTDEGMAMYNAIWTKDYALWFTERENQIHKIDANTGKLIEKLALNKNVNLRTYDTINQRYKLKENFTFNDSTHVFPAWYSNIIVDDKCYFMCFKKSNRYKLENVKPQYTFGRLNLTTKKVDYLEMPVQYDIKEGKKELIWHKNLSTETKNIRELDIAFDKRSQSDGWTWNFNANPILINDKLFFTTMSGIVYCIDTSKEKFDKTALVGISDLGPKGKTWTLNTPSFVDGKLYHRTSKQLICIGNNEN